MSDRLLTKMMFILFLFLSLALMAQAQILRFKGSGSPPPSKTIEVSDAQMNDFLNKLDSRFEQRYSDLIHQIRQAWMSRDMGQYDSLVTVLVLKIKNDYFGDQGPQPTGGCQQYLGWYQCSCGPALSCCCPFACHSVPINLCIGMDMGGIIGGGGGGGGGGGMYYICRPIGFTKR